MDRGSDESKWTVRAPAKLNLYLDVLGRRVDGFHELETLMVPVRLWDSLSIVPTAPSSDGHPGGLHLEVVSSSTVRPPPVAPDPIPASDNLVVRALELLRQRSGCRMGARVALVKRIPMAAGLGGGSSDAAAALLLGNRAWRLRWPLERLSRLASELGSDVPFFLRRSAAVCRGRGEQVEAVRGVRPLNVVIVKPPFGLSTEAVYRAHDSSSDAGDRNVPHRLEQLVRSLQLGDLAALGRLMTNRLESAAASITAWISEIRAVFRRLDFLGHLLSGSGPTYFGVCRHRAHACRIAAMLRSRQLGLVYAVRTCP